MQTRHRIAVLVSFLAAVLVIAGCSSSSPKSDAPLPDATTLLKQSQQTTAAQKSVHLQLDVTGTIKQLPIQTLSGDLTNVPQVAAQGKASIIAFGQTFKDVDFVVADGNLYGALTPGSFTNFGPAADIYDVSKILNPDVGLANILATFTGAKAEGRETVNNIGTVKITGTVPANAVNGLANLGATGDVPATAWIREDGDHDLVQAKLEPSQGNSVQMTLSDWGKTVTVTKPAA